MNSQFKENDSWNEYFMKKKSLAKITLNLSEIIKITKIIRTRFLIATLFSLPLLPLFIRGKLGTSKIDCGDKI